MAATTKERRKEAEIKVFEVAHCNRLVKTKNYGCAIVASKRIE
jgi:hypothetical protein